jgi:hypothetical protein
MDELEQLRARLEECYKTNRRLDWRRTALKELDEIARQSDQQYIHKLQTKTFEEWQVAFNEKRELTLALEQEKARRGIRDPRPGVLSDSLIDIAISVSSAAIYDSGKEVLQRLRSRRRNQRHFTEDQLVEVSRRTLALRLELSVEDLVLTQIETTPNGDTIADYAGPNKTAYRMTMEMVEDTPVIIRLRRRAKTINPRPPRQPSTPNP